jgi:glycosyltransferase involved in cell wall biosynthesis
MKQKVSIIVPVYNTEEFLKQAIQSLQNQVILKIRMK